MKGFSPRSTDVLIQYGRPGNVPELENVAERALIMARGHVITPAEFRAGVKELDNGAKELS